MFRTRKVKILIVDDNVSFSSAAKAFLEQKGCIVKTLESPDRAIALIKKENFHIIVLDLRMPEIGGVELLSKIRKYDPHVCVIIATGHPSVDSVIETMKLNAYEYLQKPFDMAVLDEVVERAVDDMGIFTDPEEELRKHIGFTLRKLRKEHHYTLKNVSTKTGLSQSLISKIEHADTSASVSTLVKLARAFNVSEKYFFDKYTAQ